MKTTTQPVRITGLEIENVKRVAAVHLEPAETGLTTIGGDNRQGKTSVLDAIMSALGGAVGRGGHQAACVTSVVPEVLLSSPTVARANCQLPPWIFLHLLG